MEKDPASLWKEALQTIKGEISQQSFETWFLPTRQKGFSEGCLTVEVPNNFFKTWLVEHYQDIIKKAISGVCGEPVVLEIVVGHSVEKEELKQKEKGPLSFLSRPFEKFIRPEIGLNPKYTFEDFVVGPCNRFAQAASFAVAESPAKTYNPFFIYGGVGLGKTHLLQAIGHHITKHNPKLRVAYMSSERFTNQLINAIQNRTTLKFRERYRTLDVLLIDDIHFIAGKESTQEEFFHTFNVLYDARKQIVISSDSPPKEIPALEKRLVSRFEWGLITDVQPPDFETRVAILKKKSEKEAVNVPDDVVYYIADCIKTNIRELEGALIRVVAYSALVGEPVNVDVVRGVLKEFTKTKERAIDVESIQKEVCGFFGLKMPDMMSKKRIKRIAFARQVAMYLSRELTGFSFPEIAYRFGGKDHTTVLHAYNKIKREIKVDKGVGGVVSKIASNLK